ncbi:MAG: ATP synthase F1 subunit gamma [Planctomycetes bacterium]|nr:ATP synthase F1 subunit gamma [Planctomycetota bacterium]MCG2683077.1 ATP synthase F1 subunit gamma [Planctomycetales bacterium]
MAKARVLDRRRKSIRGIRKITRTMELISTAQFKRAMNRATAAAAYTRRITALVGHLARSGLEVSHPLLEPRPEPKQATLLVLSANRGMCAGYNAGVLRQAVTRYNELANVASEVSLEVVGKRGISAFRFRKIPIDEAFTHFEDRPSFAEVDVLAERYLQDFTAGRLDRLDVAFTRFESASHRQAVVETLLPLGSLQGAEDKAPARETQYEFLPSAASILDEVVPMSFRVRLFKCFLDAAVSEQIARMVAMKTATENADGMISHLSMAYNRARQGQITGELLEIIGGADALNG